MARSTKLTLSALCSLLGCFICSLGYGQTNKPLKFDMNLTFAPESEADAPPDPGVEDFAFEVHPMPATTMWVEGRDYIELAAKLAPGLRLALHDRSAVFRGTAHGDNAYLWSASADLAEFARSHRDAFRVKAVEILSDEEGAVLDRTIGELIISFTDGALPDDNEFFGYRVETRSEELGFLTVVSESGFSSESIKTIAELDGVTRIEPDYHLNFHTGPFDPSAPNDPEFKGQSWLKDIGAPQAWRVVRSSPAIVAVIDGGVDYQHPDLCANIWTDEFNRPGYDFVDKDCFPQDSSWDGHGTLITGVIAASGNNGVGATGVLWKGSVMPLRISRSRGAAEAAAAMVWAAERGASIINCSFDSPHTPELLEAVQFVASRGLVLVSAAGGDRSRDLDVPEHEIYPQCYRMKNQVTVLAVTRGMSGLIKASYSNYGQNTVHIGARGSNISTTSKNGTYSSGMGTSFAAPQFAAACALVLAHPKYNHLDPVEAKDLLLSRAVKAPNLAGLCSTGGVLSIEFLTK